MSWTLPVSLVVGGTDFAIRTDYRDILNIFRAFNDPDLPEWAQYEVMLRILYPDYEKITDEQKEEALKVGVDFLNAGMAESDDKRKPDIRLMDWEQDAKILIPAINKVSGVRDIRSLDYLHWWTFLGYYMEIGDGLFSQVLNIRYKKAHGQKLEKWERDFERENKQLIRLEKPLSEEEQAVREAEEAALRELI